MRNYIIALVVACLCAIVGIVGIVVNSHDGVFGWFIAYSLIFGASFIMISMILGDFIDALDKKDE